jgi:prophage regulatory protein
VGRNAPGIQHVSSGEIMSVKPIYLDLAGVAAALSLSPMGVRRLMAAGDFPKSRLLSGRRIGWLMREVEEWAEARPVSSMLPVGKS